MLEIRKIRETPELFIEGLRHRFLDDPEGEIQGLLDLDEARRSLMTQQEELQAEMNKISRSIGGLMREGKKEEAEQAKSRTTEIKQTIKSLTDQVHAKDAEQVQLLLNLPNKTHESVPSASLKKTMLSCRATEHTPNCMKAPSHTGNWPMTTT